MQIESQIGWALKVPSPLSDIAGNCIVFAVKPQCKGDDSGFGSENKDGEFFVDKKFHENMKGLRENKIPVGIYYYSYADSKEKAKKEAKWVIKQIKKYDIDLPVVFDWENWNHYREYNLSFHSLTEVAESFLNTIESAGYDGMLYSSKYYLEEIWYPTKYKIWLAHYTDETNYKGKYKVWQMCQTSIRHAIHRRCSWDSLNSPTSTLSWLSDKSDKQVTGSIVQPKVVRITYYSTVSFLISI